MAGKQSADVRQKIIHSNALMAAIILIGIISVGTFSFVEPKKLEIKSYSSLISDEDYSFEYSIPEIDLTQEPVVHARRHRTHKRCHVPKVNKCQRVSNFTGPR